MFPRYTPFSNIQKVTNFSVIHWSWMCKAFYVLYSCIYSSIIQNLRFPIQNFYVEIEYALVNNFGIIFINTLRECFYIPETFTATSWSSFDWKKNRKESIFSGNICEIRRRAFQNLIVYRLRVGSICVLGHF